MKLDWKTSAIAFCLILMGLYPVVHGNMYILHVMIMFFIWASICTLWDLMAGYAGILSLSNIGFVMIGAYFSGIFSKLYGIPPFISILIAATMTMISALLVVSR